MSEMTNVQLLPLARWPDACPSTLAADLLDAAERDLGERVMILSERQRELKARLAATGVAEHLRRAELSAWTWEVFAAEARLRRLRRQAR